MLAGLPLGSALAIDPAPLSAVGAAAAARTAQEGDVEDRSVARQVANAIRFIEAKGWILDQAHICIDDGISGAEVKTLVSKQRMLN